jgi:hypothetical protein
MRQEAFPLVVTSVGVFGVLASTCHTLVRFPVELGSAKT